MIHHISREDGIIYAIRTRVVKGNLKDELDVIQCEINSVLWEAYWPNGEIFIQGTDDPPVDVHSIAGMCNKIIESKMLKCKD